MYFSRLLLSGLMIYLSPSSMMKAQDAEAPKMVNELPQPNVLALTPENFCSGIPNVMAQTMQNITVEVNAICPGMAPAPVLREILANPYMGDARNADDYVITLRSTENIPNGSIQIFVAYAMKIPRNGAKALLAEEFFVEVPYAQEILRINSSFLPAPANNGDADISFTVEQVTNVNHRRVMFNDVSRHELRMYRLHPNNFDFLLAARTLAAPSEQFSKAVVLKGVIADEASPKDSAYLITVFNFIMNDRDEDEGVEETFLEFIMNDMQSVYQAHIQG